MGVILPKHLQKTFVQISRTHAININQIKLEKYNTHFVGEQIFISYN